ncbi:hypothetical protein [Candidatus Magnetomonas plexicatena]|uniref:hypothetical protein n=1 Tax=Candidatus Magnetomonas plexicatena TaxID=2552947 RepID=UPI00110458C4|nr:hypothetical protein E2O03_005265 [Nitrospirales bacterium LBB_01]
MEIASSNINLSSKSSTMEKYEHTESLSFWSGSGANGIAIRPTNQQPAKDTVTLSTESLSLLDAKKSSVNKNEQVDNNLDPSLSGDLKYLILKLILEKMTGKKIDISNIADAANGNQPQDSAANKIQQPQSSPTPVTQQPQQNWALSYTSHDVHQERQDYAFNAQGIIKTQDGQDIKFSIGVNMSYEHSSESSVSLSAGNVKLSDPLVINFGGNASDLTGGTFNFDLNSNGKDVKMPMTGSGSGFLALDLNNDGVINNGKELFGPATGNGFSELSAYDEDKNKWIDEKDSVFNKLSVLRKSQNGDTVLSSLKDSGVAAIYLDSIGGHFNYKDGAGNLLGKLASMGLYTKNDGTVGTIEQVDMHT